MDRNAPITVDCEDMTNQEELYPGTDKGILQDCLDFFWNLWAGDEPRFTIDEINPIYSEVSSYSWADLVDDVDDVYTEKQQKCNDTGKDAGLAERVKVIYSLRVIYRETKTHLKDVRVDIMEEKNDIGRRNRQ